MPAKDAFCTYLVDWVATKTRWKLAVDQTEKKALQARATECPLTTRVSTEIAS
ncbi:hypothetical protein JW613_30965 [Streptomyces smyrnaeus]|uniref:Uncharacterized protein n=1 Tax=Streptomyces smyrnaeus TaxID=1387713 RepID=A0ABS3Y4T1_9ACTN|nr:hypothetical protein [Streptomyces smyrnaeus]MBO8202669.1 hypothetical protein [Streptomyces smyrnaeus]